MEKIKLTFSNFGCSTNGISTKAWIKATLFHFNKNGWYCIASKRFNTKITCHKNDKYDLNKAKNILQVSLEQKAYLWAKKLIDKEIEKEKDFLKAMNIFSEKATHIIEHDANYINNLWYNYGNY